MRAEEALYNSVTWNKDQLNLYDKALGKSTISVHPCECMCE